MAIFDEKDYLKQSQGVIEQIPSFEAIADALKDKKFEQIIVPAVGGTWARWYPVVRYMKKLTKIPIILENAADYCVCAERKPNKGTLVLTASNSGNTKEIVNAAKYSKENGAIVVSVGQPESCELKDASNFYVHAPMHYGENMYLLFFIQALSIMNRLGSFDDYPLWIEQMKNLHPALLLVKDQFDPLAATIGKKLAKAPFAVLVSSGILEKISYWYTLCVLQECQWIHATSVSSADFFHGSLELVDDSIPLLLIKGVDEFRVLDERVEAFAKKVNCDLCLIDIADYPLNELDQRYADMYSVFVAASLLSERLEMYLELNTGHSLDFRRYYRRIDY